MKRFFLLAFTMVIGAASFAQGGDTAQMAQRFKERMKPQLIEKTGLSEAEAEKVLDIQLESRMQMRSMREMSAGDREKKIKEMQQAAAERYKAIPLTAEKMKAVQSFFEEQRPRGERRGGNQ